MLMVDSSVGKSQNQTTQPAGDRNNLNNNADIERRPAQKPKQAQTDERFPGQ